jgi:hypothetical protein
MRVLVLAHDTRGNRGSAAITTKRWLDKRIVVYWVKYVGRVEPELNQSETMVHTFTHTGVVYS